MPDTLSLSENTSKETRYCELLPQIKSLIEHEKNTTANLANISAALKEAFKFWWVGFYLVDKEDLTQLVLGPFQGPIACTRIRLGKGVCGTSWLTKKTVIVDDVDKFPGHIACSSFSKSEIVVPIFHPNDISVVIGVLDVDSEYYSNFDRVDEEYLVKLCEMIRLNWN